MGGGGGACPASGSGNIAAGVNLPPGGTATFTVTGTVSAAAVGTLSNTATIATPAGVTDPNPANNSATDTDTLVPTADLAIAKTDGTATAVPGTPVTYTIVASNAGPSNASGATVADVLPAVLTGASWTCVGVGGGACPASGVGNINAAVSLPVGAAVTFTLTATLSAAATGTLVEHRDDRRARRCHRSESRQQFRDRRGRDHSDGRSFDHQDGWRDLGDAGRPASPTRSLHRTPDRARSPERRSPTPCRPR